VQHHCKEARPFYTPQHPHTKGARLPVFPLSRGPCSRRTSWHQPKSTSFLFLGGKPAPPQWPQKWQHFGMRSLVRVCRQSAFWHAQPRQSLRAISILACAASSEFAGNQHLGMRSLVRVCGQSASWHAQPRQSLRAIHILLSTQASAKLPSFGRYSYVT